MPRLKQNLPDEIRARELAVKVATKAMYPAKLVFVLKEKEK